MKRVIRLLLPALLLLLPSLLLFVTGYGQQKPNIIFILADDLGYGDLGSYGQKMIRTPHIDSLAAQGMRFTNYYAGCSVCAPSRETLMTGKHTGHTYIRGNFLTDSKEDPPMPDNKMTVAEFLKGAGYNTALIGKWGLGGELHGPEKQGFDYTYGYLDQIHAHDYYPAYLYENGKKFPIDENKDSARKVLSEDLFIGKTLDYLGKTDSKKPFFLYLPYTFPHGEYNLPPDTPYSATSWPKQFKVYATMVTRLDGYVAEIMKTLKEKGIADNTLVVLASDNGANMGFAKFFNSNGPLSGSKFGLYEGGIRVPMIVRWPGKIRPGVVSDLITASWDMLPTICNVAGLPAPKDIDGISILPELTGGNQTARHDYLYWEYYNYNYNWYKPGETMPRNWLESVAVRMGKWKAMKKDLYKDKQASVELYDLEADPGEKSNVAAQHPDLVSKAAALFASNTEANTPWFPYQPKYAAWRSRLLHYVNTDMGKSDGGFGWPDQYDSHLEPSFAAVGILRDVDALPEDREPLISYIRNHHPQRQLNKETGPSGFVPRTLLYEQIQSLEWLGADVSGFKKEVEAEKSDTKNLYNYEDHGYGVFDQEVLTLVNDALLQAEPRAGYPGLTDYIMERRRGNGSFNNAPARFGGDGNILNTYWGLYAMQILGKTNEKKQETRKWLQACQLKNGGFTHQPSPVIGGNDDVAYTWAAVKALNILSARPARLEECIKYLVSLLNADGGFGNRPGLPSTPMSTYYALDALKMLNAVARLDAAPAPGRVAGDAATGGVAGDGAVSAKAADLSGYKVFTVQIQAIGNGSPSEAVTVADSMHIQLWGAKNAPAGWIETAQKIADERKVQVLFFHADEPYGKNVLVEGMGSFGHILDNYYPAGSSLTIPDSALWQDLSAGFLPSLKNKPGGLVLQISNNEPLVRMLLDESIKTGQGYTAISTVHFGQNFLFFLPFLYQYRHQLPFIALQDAHGTESWWWSNDLLAYRTLFLAKEPTYAAMLDAIKANRIVAVRHDSVTAFKTRMLGGAPGVQEYIRSLTPLWKWWGDTAKSLPHPWVIGTLVNPTDSFEIGRQDKGSVIRIRTWWHTDKQIMKFPLVALKQLFVDGKPVEYQYVERKNRMGVVTDSYYLYELPGVGVHTVKVVCVNIKSGAERTETVELK